MAQFTYLNFRRDNGKIGLILFIIFVFSTIKFFTQNNSPYFGTYALLSLVCLIANNHFGRKATRMLHNPELRMNWFEIEILKTFLISVLGIGTLYMFFIDGLYGIYLLFKSFSWGTLIVRMEKPAKVTTLLRFKLTICAGVN